MSAPTVAHLLAKRANTTPGALAYTFLADGEREAGSLDYGTLHHRAMATAELLRECGTARGDRVVLLFPPGLEFIPAFLGVLYAGAIAVPCYPPHPAQLVRALPRLRGIVRDADPSIVLCPPEVLGMAARLGDHAPELAALPWLDVSDCAPGATRIDARQDDVAFLQYTSGSTSVPRGVMVSHANLMHNLGYAAAVEENDHTSRSVSWLPVIHDMGLIEGVLQPLFSGYPAYLMSPAAFLQRPMRWMEAIHRYRATNSGGPNFAYDLCVRKSTPESRAAVDLSSWRVAYNGAEPIRASTLREFFRAFGPSGFRWKSFYPVYGLAEATLAVSSGRQDDPPSIRSVDRDALGCGSVIDGGAAGRELVASGYCSCDTEVAIVEPDTRRRCAPERVGEIWVSSPSVAQGYWRRPEESAATFGAVIAGEDGRTFLRTGDLGAIVAGELFVVGRIKDLLIVRGVKYYPQDIELTVEREHPAVRPGCVAAYALEGDDIEHVGVMAEIDPRRFRLFPDPDAAMDDVIAAIREHVLAEHGVTLWEVVLVGPGGVPKTSSGKLRRHACARAARGGELPLLRRWSHGVIHPRVQSTASDAAPRRRTGT